MAQCEMGVARDGGGTATVVVTRPDGRKRFIFFEKGKAVSADLSQADGNMNFRATKNARGIYLIDASDPEQGQETKTKSQQPTALTREPLLNWTDQPPVRSEDTTAQWLARQRIIRLRTYNPVLTWKD